MEVQRIWDCSPHNAFTDLAAFDGRLWCVFREGSAHVSTDGVVQLLTSTDGGHSWQDAGQLRIAGVDMRDPKLNLTPQGELALTVAGVHRLGDGHLDTYAWYRREGGDWGAPQRIGDRNYWLWRVRWHGSQALSVAYCTRNVDRPHVRLYRSNDGHRFQPWVPTLRDAGYPNETDLLFGATGDCHCLLRRDGRPATAMLGHSRPPYNRWSWRTLGVRIGGPVWCRIGGEIYAVVRLYDGRVRTAICRLHLAKARLEERLVLPSGGDSSYAGLLPQDDRLLISYYSAHEQQRCCIYFATVGLSELG